MQQSGVDVSAIQLLKIICRIMTRTHQEMR